MSHATGPTLPLPFEPEDVEPRRRRVWPWLVAVAVVVVLMVGAFFAGEWIARGLVTTAVTQQLSTRQIGRAHV